MTEVKQNPKEGGEDLKDVLQDATTCAICLEAFVRPVTAHCGHSYCRRCLRNSLKADPQRRCPTCRQPLQREALEINRALWEIIKTVFPDRADAPDSPIVQNNTEVSFFMPSTTTAPSSSFTTNSNTTRQSSSLSRFGRQQFIPPRRIHTNNNPPPLLHTSTTTTNNDNNNNNNLVDFSTESLDDALASLTITETHASPPHHTRENTTIPNHVIDLTNIDEYHIEHYPPSIVPHTLPTSLTTNDDEQTMFRNFLHNSARNSIFRPPRKVVAGLFYSSAPSRSHSALPSQDSISGIDNHES